MSKPYIILVITDQQRFDTIAALSHDWRQNSLLETMDLHAASR
jgi:hypothetical protein